MNQLDLCGTSGLAAVLPGDVAGLDMLLAHERRPERVGVGGLSGGGWQTICHQLARHARDTVPIRSPAIRAYLTRMANR